MHHAYQKHIKAFSLVLFWMFFLTHLASAKPVVRLLMNPQFQTLYLSIAPPKIMLSARATEKGLRFNWHLEGPGELIGRENSPVMEYFPPKVLEQESAEVIITVIVTEAKGQKTEATQIFTLQAPKDFELIVKTNQHQYKVGDEMSISIRANQDSYFRLFHIDAQGVEALLYPDDWEQDNFLKAGQWFKLPISGGKWVMTQPIGTEMIIAEAQTEPFSEQTTIVQEKGGGMTKGIEKTTPLQASQTVVRYEIVP